MPIQSIRIADLMEASGVKFGTSGARGLVTDMSDRVCYLYTQGYLQYLDQIGELSPGSPVAVGGDLRPSTGRIMAAVAQACRDKAHAVRCCGRLPTPALALEGINEGIPTAMVTGSHIPDDRNGIKYTKKAGEILKTDEAGMKEQVVEFDDSLFDDRGMLRRPPKPDVIDPGPSRRYVARYLDYFGKNSLQGLRVGVFQHSAVGRDLMVEIYEGLGAEVIVLGRSETFIPVDTEAIRPEDVDSARSWAKEHGLDAIVSTDGDSDRPLVADEHGKFFRGDVAGILVAAQLGAQAVVTSVSCNTALEKSGWFPHCARCRIGSPWVIETMQNLESEGLGPVVGYEANGGFLIQSPIETNGRRLTPLPTRDAFLVQLALLERARQKGVPLSKLSEELPERYTVSDRLKNFPQDLGQAKLAELKDRENVNAAFSQAFGPVAELDRTDGLRITFTNEEVVHLRASGNAPEFRCYTEAATENRALTLNRMAMDILAGWR